MVTRPYAVWHGGITCRDCRWQCGRSDEVFFFCFAAGESLVTVKSIVASRCTSEYGISGISLVSASSFVIMFATFVVTMGISRLRS